MDLRGERVLVAFDIKCGNCFFCDKQLYSSCDKTNPSEVMEFMYGQVSHRGTRWGKQGTCGQHNRPELRHHMLCWHPDRSRSVCSAKEAVLVFSEVCVSARGSSHGVNGLPHGKHILMMLSSQLMLTVDLCGPLLSALQRTAGIFGYSHLTGGYAGGQAEFTRVPLGEAGVASSRGRTWTQIVVVLRRNLHAAN
jgi:threonine dehydrogenase-like Zn-dependent dehydrogenase